MRVAIATDFFSPWIGGPATFIENFAAYLAGASHQVEVIAPSPAGPPGIETGRGFVVRRTPTIPLPVGYDLRVTARLDRVWAALRATRAEVLQVHHPFPLGLATLRAARSFGIPVVAVNHTIPECSLYGIREHRILYSAAMRAFGRYLVWFLRQADAVCTPTHTAAALLRALGFRRPIQVISNGIDTTRFQPATDRRMARHVLGLPDRPIVLYTGRLDSEKDMRTWLRAAAIAAGSTDAHLVVGGQGTERPRLERLAEELGLGNRISFPGYLPAADLPLLYQAANVYCITSAVELQSITTLEALASGLPVVAARAAALPELVEDGANGYLAAPGDVEGFARGISTLLRAPEQAAAMGSMGRRKAEQHSLGVVARHHETLLARVREQQAVTLRT